MSAIRGITLRDQFAANAPWPIPDWFVPTGIPTEPSVPLAPELYFNDNVNNAATFEPLYIYYTRETNFWNEDDYRLEETDGIIPQSLKDDVSVYWGAYDYDFQVHETWRVHKEKETFFQWRYYYADDLLNKRFGNNES